MYANLDTHFERSITYENREREKESMQKNTNIFFFFLKLFGCQDLTTELKSKETLHFLDYFGCIVAHLFDLFDAQWRFLAFTLTRVFT